MIRVFVILCVIAVLAAIATPFMMIEWDRAQVQSEWEADVTPERLEEIKALIQEIGALEVKEGEEPFLEFQDGRVVVIVQVTNNKFFIQERTTRGRSWGILLKPSPPLDNIKSLVQFGEPRYSELARGFHSQ